MRRLGATMALLGALGVLAASGAVADSTRTYKVELDNAFGLVVDSHVRVAGVESGAIKDLDVNEQKRAVVTIEIRGSAPRLRSDATCESRPQSLIAEYFIDCQPGRKGAELDEGATLPVTQTATTVQPDLVNNILREPYRDRLRLIINEFGTGLAGRPKDLNRAVKSGAPALRETEKVLRILARQNRTIRDLNVNSDAVIGALAANRENVSRFVTEARETAQASAERRSDIAASFNRLPRFLGEMRPAMARLGELADEQTPVLEDLRASASELERFTKTIGPFSDASLPSLRSLGDAGAIGQRALTKAGDEISALSDVGENVEPVSDELGKFLEDLDDRDRAVQPDARAPVPEKGFTGLENLLSYAYYQAGSVNTFDEVGYMLRFTIFEAEQTHCAEYSTKPAKPMEEAYNSCMSQLGPNQPGLTQQVDIPPYDPSVCPNGSTDNSICTPNQQASGNADQRAQMRTDGRTPDAVAHSPDNQPPPGSDGPKPAPKVVPQLPKPLKDLLDIPSRTAPKLPGVGDRLQRGLRTNGKKKRPQQPAGTELLDFLLGD